MTKVVYIIEELLTSTHYLLSAKSRKIRQLLIEIFSDLQQKKIAIYCINVKHFTLFYFQIEDGLRQEGQEGEVTNITFR